MTQDIESSGDGYGAFLAAALEAEKIIQAHPNLSDADLAEGYLYLAGMWQFHLERRFKGGDVDHPCFVRVMDSHRSWGLPTPDHHYYSAQIDGNGEYKIKGFRGNTVDYCFEVLSGLVGDDGVVGSRIDALEASKLEVSVDGSFELMVGGAIRPSNWLRAGPEARTIFVRQTSNDWKTERASPMLIERIDHVGRVASLQRPTRASVQQQFHQAAQNLVQQVRFLDDFCRHWSTALPLNDLPTPSMGPADAGYFPGQFNTKCRFSISPDEALLLTLEPSTARYQSVCLGHPLWFNNLNPRVRQSSLNLAQSIVSRDGNFHYVISLQDPEVGNWLDTVGQTEGFIFIRYQRVFGDLPSKPLLKSIALSNLRKELKDAGVSTSTNDQFGTLRSRKLSMDGRFF